MIRRSRISVRPNVKPVGRSAATSRETPQESETPVEVSNDAGVKAGGQKVAPEVKADCTVLAAETSENAGSQNGDATDQSDLSVTAADVSDQRASAVSLSTRRKRFSVLPNLSKPRSTPSSSLTSSKHSKSPVGPKSTPEIPPVSLLNSLDDNQESAPELLSVSTKSLRSPAPKLPSSTSNKTSRSSTFINQAVNTTEPTPEKTLSAPECTPELPPGPIAKSEGKPKRKKPKPVTPTQDSVETSPANQDPAESSQSDPATVSKSQNEPIIQDGSDLKSSGSSKKPEQHVPQALRTLNDPADRLRLARAKKLRELLKKEMNKQKQKEKPQRPQTGGSEIKSTKDHTKMTMRDLIYYLPSTNPMKSHTEDEQRAETDFSSSPKAVSAVQCTTEQNAAEQEEDEEQGGEEEEPMLAPRVKVAEDGSLIIDEESLTVRVQRMKGPNPVEDRDPIFERGSTTTYSSFRKGTYTKPWSNRETDMFFLAISMVGTDFSMIGQLFPHRARVEIKNKFKKEERANSWRIDKAFKEKRRLDLDFFNKLLAQILKDEEERRKKKKRTSQMDKKVPCRRPGERKRKIYSSDSEEDGSSGSDTIDGEKEKENVCDDGGSSAASKKKRAGASQRRSKHASQSAEDEVEEEAEKITNEEPSAVIELNSAEEDTESFGFKPVQRWRKKSPVLQRKAEDTHTSGREKNTKESDSDTPSASVWERKRHTADVIFGGLQDSEDEEEPDLTTIQEHILNKPTRSGRIPKLSQHMIRATADEEDDEEEEQLPPLPHPPDVWCRGSQRNVGRSVHVPRRGKSRLVTLRASPTEDEEEEYGTYQDEENDFTNVEEENQAFVPMGLRSVTVVQADVEETMEELDISVNVPDILGISQNAVCPESSCERALAPMGSVPCEHQLNLLVDVIEFLTPDHMEVSEEAARTLLTIGHSAHITQSGEPSSTGEIIIVENSLNHVHEEVLVETMDQSQTEFEPCVVTSDPASETDLVITADKTITQSPSHDSASTAEPISSQESSDPSIEIQPETSSISAPEPTSSKTQRNLLPKHKSNMRKVSRTTLKEPAEALASSSEKISAPVKGDEEAVESHLSTPKAPSHPEPEEHLSEISEEQEKYRREDCSSVVSLEKKIEDGVMGEETQEAHSESIPSSSGSECSVKPSQSVRRCRGPKPKPNLVRSVRTTHTVTHITQNLPAVPNEKPAPVNACTDIWQPEEGAHVICEPKGETPTDPVTVIPEADPEELPPSACEPVFILSLTEVLPALTEGAGLVADPLPLSAAPGSLSEPIRATETPTADVEGTGPAGDQVFSQLLTDPLIPVSEERETENRENESRRGKKKQSSSQARRGEHSPSMQKSSAPEEPDEPAVEPSSSSSSSIYKPEENIKETELPAKRSKLSESSRRGKLQIKPKQTPKKPRCVLSSSDETASVPASSREMALEDMEPRPLESKHLLTEAPSSHSLDESSKASTAATTLRPHVRAEAPPPQMPSSSQGIVENIRNPHTGPVETCGVHVGVESQPVQQNTHQASTGPLMRPGRRPKGFLSFMSSTSVQRPSESSRVPQKPAIIKSRAGRRRAAPSTSAPPPTSSLQMSSEPQAETSNAGGENQEPTSVSAFFFNDIFTVVDEQGET